MICSWIINNNTLLMKAIITIYFIVFECKSIFSSFYRYLCFIRASLLFIPSSSTLRHPFREALPALPRLVVFFFFFTRYPGNPPSLPPYLPSSSSPPPPPASASRHCWEAGRGVNGWIMRLFTVHVNVPNGILKVTAAGRDHSRFRSSSDSSRSGKCVQERSSRRDCTGENCSSVSSEQQCVVRAAFWSAAASREHWWTRTHCEMYLCCTAHGSDSCCTTMTHDNVISVSLYENDPEPGPMWWSVRAAWRDKISAFEYNIYIYIYYIV